MEIDFKTHEKKLTYMAFVVGILACLYFNPYGFGAIWALAVIVLMIWYGWMSKKRSLDGSGEGNENPVSEGSN